LENNYWKNKSKEEKNISAIILFENTDVSKNFQKKTIEEIEKTGNIVDFWTCNIKEQQCLDKMSRVKAFIEFIQN